MKTAPEPPVGPEEEAAEGLTDLEVGFRLAGHIVQPRLNRIEGPAGVEQVEPRLMRVLLCLARQPGAVVDRQTLLVSAWPGVVVSEESLTRSISDLRKLFGDPAQRPRVIETIRQVGYRLIAIPEALAAAGDQAAESLAGPPPAAAGAAPRSASPQELSRPQSMSRSRPFWIPGLGLLLALAGLVWLAASRDAPEAVGTAEAPRPVPLTSLEGTESSPALSPDGQQVAFAWAPGPDLSATDLYLKRVGSENPIRLTQDDAFEEGLVWSPDGTALAYLRWDAEGCSLWTVAVPAGDHRRLASCDTPQGARLSWSPDGRWLAFSEFPATGETAGVTLFDLESLSKRRLTTPPESAFLDRMPRFSPDGRTVAFVRGRSAASLLSGLNPIYGRLMTVGLEGGEPRLLSSEAREILGLEWSHDGRFLIYGSSGSGVDYGLRRLDLQTLESAWWLRSSFVLRNPSRAAEGDRLVIERWDAGTDVWRVPISEGAEAEEAAAVLSSTRSDFGAQPSPDGKRLAFVSSRSGHLEIWNSAADGTEPVQLTDLRHPHTSHPSWSPDGSRIVFESRVGEASSLYAVSSAGGGAVPWTGDETDDRSPVWSSDGSRIFFASRRSGEWQIWVLELDSEGRPGPPRQLTREGGWGPQEIVDDGGSRLVYLHPEAGGLWTVSDRGGDEALWKDEPTAVWGRWTVAAGEIFTLNGPGGPRLLRGDRRSGEAREWRSLPGVAPFGLPTLSATRDGSALSVTLHAQVVADLMLLEP